MLIRGRFMPSLKPWEAQNVVITKWISGETSRKQETGGSYPLAIERIWKILDTAMILVDFYLLKMVMFHSYVNLPEGRTR